MNVRIRELIKQAGDYVNEVYTLPVRSKTPDKIWEDGHIDWNTQFNEKLAELIVRECVDVVGKATASPNGYQAIMKHFGVEV